MEKLPESRVSFDLFSSHTARSGVALLLAPQGDVLGGEFLLQDGHHGRLVLVDGDRLGERVFEEVVEGVGGDVAFRDGVGGAVNAAADCRHPSRYPGH